MKADFQGLCVPIGLAEPGDSHFGSGLWSRACLRSFGWEGQSALCHPDSDWEQRGAQRPGKPLFWAARARQQETGNRQETREGPSFQGASVSQDRGAGTKESKHNHRLSELLFSSVRAQCLHSESLKYVHYSIKMWKMSNRYLI